MSTSLLDHLQERGYDPQDVSAVDGPSEDWYDLTVSGSTGTIRVCMYPGDGYRVDIYAFDHYMTCEWQVSFSPNTPGAVILAALVAVEGELTAKRGGR